MTARRSSFEVRVCVVCLAVLTVHRGAAVSVDRLAEVLGVSVGAVRSLVSRLRQAVGERVIATSADGYALASVDVDAWRFEAMYSQARGLGTNGEAVLNEALSLWRGDAFGEFASEDWARAEAARLNEMRADAVSLLRSVAGPGRQAEMQRPIPGRGDIADQDSASSSASGVVTFLFTDIEGSTSRWEHEPDTMRQALADHDRVFHDVVGRNGGSIFKHTGDGVCAVFSAPRERAPRCDRGTACSRIAGAYGRCDGGGRAA